eukprot:5372576-Amphidinium_carterae.1
MSFVRLSLHSLLQYECTLLRASVDSSEHATLSPSLLPKSSCIASDVAKLCLSMGLNWLPE